METTAKPPAPNGGYNNLRSEPLTLECFQRTLRSLKGKNFKGRRASARQIPYYHTIKNLTSFEPLREKTFKGIPLPYTWCLSYGESSEKKLVLSPELKDSLVSTFASLMIAPLRIMFCIMLRTEAISARIRLADVDDLERVDLCYLRANGTVAIPGLEVEQRENYWLKESHEASLTDVTEVVNGMWAHSQSTGSPIECEVRMGCSRFYQRGYLEDPTTEHTPLTQSGDLLLSMEMFAGPWDLEIDCHDADEVAAPNWDRANSVLWDAPIERLEGTYDDGGDLLTIRSRYDKGFYTLIFSNKHGIAEVPEFLQKTGVKFELEPW